MNQQCIFNQDFQADDLTDSVKGSVLHQGLRRNVFIKKPSGWELAAWFQQVQEDSFYWEDEIEAAVARARFAEDGSIHLDGAA